MLSVSLKIFVVNDPSEIEIKMFETKRFLGRFPQVENPRFNHQSRKFTSKNRIFQFSSFHEKPQAG